MSSSSRDTLVTSVVELQASAPTPQGFVLFCFLFDMGSGHRTQASGLCAKQYLLRHPPQVFKVPLALPPHLSYSSPELLPPPSPFPSRLPTWTSHTVDRSAYCGAKDQNHLSLFFSGSHILAKGSTAASSAHGWLPSA